MADFFFFTDVDLLNSQTASQAYGPAGTSGTDELFRVTSLHTATGTPKAYAICDGTVCVQQDQTSSSLVNLILRPSQRLNINSSVVQYIIYKGILKASLFDGSGDVIIDPANNLASSVKVSWDIFTTIAGLPASSPPGAALGINIDASTPDFSDTDPIDHLFYRDNVSDQFPRVNGGWVIGDFDPTLFGLTIVVENVAYTPLLVLARNSENLVTVAQPPSSPTPADTFQYWHMKEEILNFVDPCAFYGSMYADKVRSKTSTGTFSKTEGNDIYDLILKGAQHTTLSTGNFYNRNFIFLDIRNEHNQSFNYYQNYGNTLNITLNSGTQISVDYYNSGWPILILNSSGNPLFPSGNTSSKNVIDINLPQGDNTFPLAYISQGYKNGLYPFRKQLSGKNKFIELTVPASYTSAIELATPNRSSNSDTTVISCIIKVKYFKKLDRTSGNPPASSGTTIRSTDFIDSLFPLLNMAVPFPFSTLTGLPKIRVKVYDEEVYVDWLNEHALDFVASIGIAEDTDTVSFFAFAKDIHKRPLVDIVRNSISLNSRADSSENFYLNLVDDDAPDNRLYENTITLSYLSPSSVQLLKILPDDPSIIGKFTIPDFEKQFMCITFKKSTLTDIKATLGTLSNAYKIFLGVANRNDRTGNPSDTQSNDSPPVQYLRYDVVLKGFSIDGSGNITATEYTPLNTSSNPYQIFN